MSTPAVSAPGQERLVGKVFATIHLTNAEDQTEAKNGHLPPSEVRSLQLGDVLVDTGAYILCLPEDVIAKLGLAYAGDEDVSTAAGYRTMRRFDLVRLEVEGRSAVFDCLELPVGTSPLLGVIPMERLGLEPDLRAQRLRLLPKRPGDSFLTVL